MNFKQYAKTFENTRTNTIETANKARQLLYNKIKNIEHQYKREIFFDDNTKNNNNEKQQKDSDYDYGMTTDKEQTTSKPKERTTNKENNNNDHDKRIEKDKEKTTNNPKGKTTNKQNNVYDHNNTLKKDILITGTSLNAGIGNLWKEIRKQYIFLGNADTSNYILHLGSTWLNTHTIFNTTEAIQDYNRLFIITAFIGIYFAGHWHLTIIKRQDVETRGYIIDSYG